MTSAIIHPVPPSPAAGLRSIFCVWCCCVLMVVALLPTDVHAMPLPAMPVPVVKPLPVPVVKPLPVPVVKPLPVPVVKSVPVLVDPCALKEGHGSKVFLDLAKLGGASMIIGGKLMLLLQEAVKAKLAAPPMKLLGSRDKDGAALNGILDGISSSWTDILARNSFRPGLPVFLQLFGSGGDERSLLVQAVCAMYPWTAGSDTADVAALFGSMMCGNGVHSADGML